MNKLRCSISLSYVYKKQKMKEKSLFSFVFFYQNIKIILENPYNKKIKEISKE